jgi:hypothetical protein
MKASELISALQLAIQINGDLPVYPFDEYDRGFSEIENIVLDKTHKNDNRFILE